MSTAAAKDVIYIDVDDEITGIIDKVRASHHKIVALVLPKRATVMQSVVNMKLLKRTADEAKKNIVLITADSNLLPLAGTIGIHVAKSLQSKPEVPDGTEDDTREVDQAVDMGADNTPDADDAAEPDASPVDATKTVGELAVGTAAVSQLDDEDDDTPVELDDEDEAAADEGAAAGAGSAVAASKAHKPKGKQFKIPNFNKFRVLMLLGIPLLIALVVGGYICLKVLPKASVTIKTDSQAIDSSQVLTLKTDPGTTLDTKGGIVLATQQSEQKTLTQQVAATGTQNNGTKAAGTIKFYNCNKDDTLSGTTHTIPAGTAVSSGGLTFITNSDVIVFPSHFLGNNCKQDQPSTSIGMTAQSGGVKYNQAAASYAVSGYNTITGAGSATSGGTDNIISVVTQADIDNATQKIGTQDTDSVKVDLQTGLAGKGLYAIPATFNTGAPQTKTSASVGQQADNVTVTQTMTYTMLGVAQGDLQKIVTAYVDTKIDTSKQAILDYGLDGAVFSLQSQNADGANVTFQATAVAGSNLNVTQIKQQVAGKKATDAEALIKQDPGVTDVTVTYSPFWVGAIPHNTAKITVSIEKPKAPAKSSSDASVNP